MFFVEDDMNTDEMPLGLLIFHRFLFLINYFNIVVVFAIHQHESAMGVHMSHHPERPSHLPPHPIRLGFPRVPALGALLHASNLHFYRFLNDSYFILVFHIFTYLYITMFKAMCS